MIVKLGWFDFHIVSIMTMSNPDGREKALLEDLTVYILPENTIITLLDSNICGNIFQILDFFVHHSCIKLVATEPFFIPGYTPYECPSFLSVSQNSRKLMAILPEVGGKSFYHRYQNKQ